MARARTLVGLAPLLLGLLLQAAPSRADKPARSPETNSVPQLAPKLDLEGPEAEAKDRARVLFQRGVAAYRAARYYEAVDHFLETQRIYPDTQLCFNVARAYENLGNGSAALRYYRDYLRQADRPSDGEEVRERVRKLEQQLAQRGVQQLTVLSQPEGATVLLDGKPVGITPWTGDIYAGKHRLALTLEKHVAHEQIIELDAHAARDISLVLLATPEPKTSVLIAPRAAAAAKQPGVSLETLLALGTGLTLLGGAIAAEAVSQETGLAPTAAFLAGSGLGVSGVGGVLLYFDLAPRSSAAGVTPLRQKDSATARP